MGLPLLFINYHFLKQTRIKFFLLAWIISVILSIFIEVLFAKMGILHILYSNVCPNSGKMTAGEGFAILGIFIFNLAGCVLGSIVAFIKTCVAQRKANEVNIL